MTSETKKRIADINKGIIPEGYKKTKVGIVPVEWEVDHIGKHLQEYREISNDIEKYPVYSSSRKGLIPQSDYYDQKEATQTNLGYKIVPVGYVTYRHMSDDDIFHFNLNTTGQSVLVSSEYPVFNAKSNANLYYIISCLNEMSRFRYFCRSQKLGGTRTRLYYKNLSMYQLSFPPLPEQQKIAEILSTQDKLIELQEKKIEQLKELKKAYLQKMFPKKGSKYPELRFKGFTDPWEQRKLGSIADKVTEKNGQLSYSETFTNSAEFGIISQRDFFDHDISNSENIGGYYVVRDNDFVYNPRISVTAPCGPINCNRLGRNGVMSPLYTVFKTHDIDTLYLEWFFKSSYWHSFMYYNGDSGARSDRFSIKNDLFFMMPIPVPTEEEQRRIGSLLSTLDKAITLHQRKSEQEKQKKKALMQLLLTGKVRCI